MDNESKLSSEEVKNASLSKADDFQLHQSETTLDKKAENSRKNALSKREIMEQLSRERFPWDE